MAKKETKEEKRSEFIARFKEFLHKKYYKKLVKAANEERALEVDFKTLDKYSPELGEYLLSNPEDSFEIVEEAVKQTELPGPVKVRFMNLPEPVSIRNLRSKHMRKFLAAEGTVKRASEIRPEIMKVVWECPDCGETTTREMKGGIIPRMFECKCGNKRDFKKIEEQMIDTRWITIEEPFELTEGDRPSQVTVLLTEDLVSPEGRRLSDPGNRIKITGTLKEIPRGKFQSAKLDFYIDTNHVEPVDIGWEHLEITKEDEEEIKKLAKNPKIYDILVDSLAPSLYGLREIKESILMQLFGGVPAELRDRTHIRGDIHILLIGDPASGKSQLLKLVPEIVPRGRYVSGKGVSVDYDDPVIFMDNGQIKTDLIGRVIDRYYKKNEHGIFVPVKNIQVPSFDPRTYKIAWRPVTSVYRHTNKEPLQKISLKTGRELRVTAGHSVYILENGKITTKKASEIMEGDYVVLPSSIPPSHNKITEINLIRELSRLPEDERKNIMVIPKNSKEKIPIMNFQDFTNPEKYNLKCTFSNHLIPAKITVDKRLIWLLGLYIADGSLTEDSSLSRKIKFDVAAKDTYILNSIKSISKKLFNVEPRVYKRKDSECFNVYIYDKIVYLLFKEILKVGIRAESKGVPDIVFNVSPKLQLEFIKGWFDGDYGVTISKSLMSDTMYLYYMNNTIATFHPRRIKRTVEFPDGHTSKVDRDVYQLKAPVPFKRFKNKHFYPPLSQFKLDFAEILQRNQYTRASLSSEKTIFSKFRKMLFNRLQLIVDGSTARDLMNAFGMKNLISCRQYLRILYKKGLVEIKNINDKNLYSLSKKGKHMLEAYKGFMKILESDFGFVQVTKNERVKPTSRYVYDFSVEGCENFVAGFGGIVCHNTGAGLTATVTKDEQFMGGWVLEAGALVLTNKGLLAIDEFEKMTAEDQVAMHEALEQGTISIAKASIVATLPARTAVLAGGNPKFSRFDPYVPISKQITVPDTLLTRFDLKFAMRDVPDAEQDKLMAEHVIKTREDEDYEPSKPKIDQVLIRKYIAYAKENSKPKLVPEVGKLLKNFYVKTRKKAEGGSAPVPITLRQLEALMRIAQASAKIQLQKEVRKEDAQRAIKLMKYSLWQLGFDPDTGMIDVDRSEGAVTSAERSRIRIILDIIDEMSATKKEILVEDIIKAAKKEDVEDTEEILEKLKREGMLFEPSPGYVQKV